MTLQGPDLADLQGALKRTSHVFLDYPISAARGLHDATGARQLAATLLARRPVVRGTAWHTIQQAARDVLPVNSATEILVKSVFRRDRPRPSNGHPERRARRACHRQGIARPPDARRFGALFRVSGYCGTGPQSGTCVSDRRSHTRRTLPACKLALASSSGTRSSCHSCQTGLSGLQGADIKFELR